MIILIQDEIDGDIASVLLIIRAKTRLYPRTIVLRRDEFVAPGRTFSRFSRRGLTVRRVYRITNSSVQRVLFLFAGYEASAINAHDFARLSDVHPGNNGASVSGKLVQGTLHTGQQVRVMPSCDAANIKSIQVRSSSIKAVKEGSFVDSVVSTGVNPGFVGVGSTLIPTVLGSS